MSTNVLWPQKTRDLHNHHFDSTVWDDFAFRHGASSWQPTPKPVRRGPNRLSGSCTALGEHRTIGIMRIDRRLILGLGIAVIMSFAAIGSYADETCHSIVFGANNHVKMLNLPPISAVLPSGETPV